MDNQKNFGFWEMLWLDVWSFLRMRGLLPVARLVIIAITITIDATIIWKFLPSIRSEIDLSVYVGSYNGVALAVAMPLLLLVIVSVLGITAERQF